MLTVVQRQIYAGERESYLVSFLEPLSRGVAASALREIVMFQPYRIMLDRATDEQASQIAVSRIVRRFKETAEMPRPSSQ